MPTAPKSAKKKKSSSKKKSVGNTTAKKTTTKDSTTKSGVPKITPEKRKSVGKHQKTMKKADLYELMSKCFIQDQELEIKLVNKGQYKEAFELLEDAQACQLTVT